ncbi:MAG: bifunctional 2-polyprenyl-6-hydroxyphenol methylase/3-demethylubiquinol 3-O-methyltransferase UbiG [Dokdonella sp.]
MQSSNVNPAEVARFEALANRWWDPDGESRPLHDLNPLRADFVAERVTLTGARVLDVGCGGGLLSEALARAAAQVTAIDLAPALLDVARLHLHESGLSVDYQQSTVEDFALTESESFDAITCMEMLEHVPDPASVIAACATLLKPGGKLFVSTLNRTPIAFGAAILGAEYVMRLLPRGTHHYAQFIKPSELASSLRKHDLELTDLAGIAWNPLTRKARLTARIDVNYIACAVKPSI